MIGNSQISVGRFTYGFENLAVLQWGEGASLTIGSFCSLAANITIYLGGNHRTDWITTYPFGHIFINELGGTDIKGHPTTKGDVMIGNDVWIGSGVTIMSGVKIGNGAVLATSSTVVKDVMPYEIVGGNPARSLKKRFVEDIINLLMQLRWWELPLPHIIEIQRTLCAPPTREVLVELLAKYRPPG
ncbi:MAG: CatB-related O-acetyltransferase [Magnetococcales bacterium]|nr:CatB-related O-acetyltransferase [Magnetococcales bacterium]